MRYRRATKTAPGPFNPCYAEMLSAERTIFAELYCGERLRKGAAPAARFEKFLTPWGSTVSVSRTISAPKDARHRPIICSSVLHAHINNLVEYSESREKHHEFRIQVRDDAGGCSH